MSVAKQVFNSLTEYIQVGFALWGEAGQSRIIRPTWCSRRTSAPQGPCTGNQQSLAHSRLWDAVVGFLHVFAHMMMKLAQVRAPLFFTLLPPDIPQLARLQLLLPQFPTQGFPAGSGRVPGEPHLPSGLASCMTPPPPLHRQSAGYPSIVSLVCVWAPPPLAQNSFMVGWCSYQSDG